MRSQGTAHGVGCRHSRSTRAARRSAVRVGGPRRRHLAAVHSLGGVGRLLGSLRAHTALIRGCSKRRTGSFRARRRLAPQCPFAERRDLRLALFLRPDTLEDLVGNSHAHTTEIGYEMHATSVGCGTTFYRRVSGLIDEHRCGSDVPEHFRQFFLPKGNM